MPLFISSLRANMSSTPISKIPAQVSKEPEDPEVLAILQEMQQAEAPAPSVVTAPPRYMTPLAPSPHVVNVPLPAEKPVYFRADILQKAAAAAIIAFVLFYPKTLAMVYEKLPQLEAFDPFLRTFLLAVVLYLVMWKFNI